MNEVLEKEGKEVIMNEELGQKEVMKEEIEVIMNEEVEKEDTKWIRWTFDKLDGINGEDKESKIKKILIKRFAKLNMELHYFRCDIEKEIMFDGFGINYDKLQNDIYPIIGNWIPYINYDVKKIVDLLPKYEKVDDVNYVLPDDYWYESKLYTK